MPSLNGRVVLLTGGAAGIGRAIALDMAAAGATVAIGDTNAAGGQRTAEEILSAGGRVSFRSCDVADAEQVDALVGGAVADFGQLDVLVNDAGISGGSCRLHELDIDAWDRTIAVNLRGTFLCARAAIPHLVRRPRSAMINIASTYGIIGAPLAPSYCASKGGIVNLTRQLAVDYSPDGLRVNAICPGYIDTDMGGHRESLPPAERAAAEARREANAALQPIGRQAQAQEVARVATFLASDEASFMTGSIVTVDGGCTATFRYGS
jgi:NAD(P)-dependent dehydrogenase (short-subunit alcohol dehydrogenase family)